MVIVDRPLTAVLSAVNETVVPLPAVTVGEPKLAVTPVGRPVAEREIVPGVPVRAAVVMLAAELVAPPLTLREPGATLIEKSLLPTTLRSTVWLCETVDGSVPRMVTV